MSFDKDAAIKESERQLKKATQALGKHMEDCPGDYFWAYGHPDRERARRVWLIKKDALEYQRDCAAWAVKNAKNIMVAEWPAGPKPDLGEYQDRSRYRIK